MYPPADPFAALAQLELDQRRCRAAEERLARLIQSEVDPGKQVHTNRYRRSLGAGLLRLGLIVSGLPPDQVSPALGASGGHRS